MAVTAFIMPVTPVIEAWIGSHHAGDTGTMTRTPVTMPMIEITVAETKWP